ncbi:MAG: hypothetical protein IE887_06375 [Campylobacterales bacterium]|nr:hypothetical protein [Campylobacterales bacterium]
MKILIVFIFSSYLYGAGSYCVALSNMKIDYTETDMYGDFADSERTNSMLGFELGYDFDVSCTYKECTKLDFAVSTHSGYSDYDGFIVSTGEPQKSKTFNIFYNISLEMIQEQYYNFGNIYYGVGLGYHAWYRELDPAPTELYRWFYIEPILGFGKKWNKFSLSTYFKYKYALKSIMTASTITEDFRLGKTDSLGLIGRVTYKLDKQLDCFSELEVAKQTIKKSNNVNGWYEPDSIDYQNILKFGITFKY